jgi:membrane-associated phospholipid phosphatase
VPALTGKKEAKLFLVANLVAIMIAVPCFTLFPAVGPWYSEHFAPFAEQAHVQAQVLELRAPHPVSFSLLDGAGIVSFPSFHVIWAIFCAAALWGIRWLRIPLCLLSAMIIASTLTSGWHYGVDVIGGLVVAVLSLTISKHILAPPRSAV